ncbi:hypothetical protein GW17_00023559 [Ensete ventricosum]|nr:hypothetical protein GW17_00023559 [Ensete ventricosum]
MQIPELCSMISPPRSLIQQQRRPDDVSCGSGQLQATTSFVHPAMLRCTFNVRRHERFHKLKHYLSSSLSRCRSPRRTAAALTFLPRFLAGPRCRSPRRTPAASFSSLCRSRLCRSSLPPLPSLTAGCCLLPPAPIADAAAVLLLRLLPTACRRC